MLPAMLVVAILGVRRGARAEFERFERAAARIMRRHGGAIERTVVASAPTEALTETEIHLVSFPDAERFAAYRADPELAALSALRDQAIASTTVYLGEPGPVY
jgi:uncharacterized protein (DUF1330 family)